MQKPGRRGGATGNGRWAGRYCVTHNSTLGIPPDRLLSYPKAEPECLM